MRTALTNRLIVAATLLGGVSSLAMGETFTGSGVVIGSGREILTNSHVVVGCESINVKGFSVSRQMATLIARDQRNDLAILRTAKVFQSVATFREGSPVRAGDAVVALGYPLSGLLAETATLTVGNVSALAGLANNSRYLQISAPVQPGNSGGPLLDASGHLIGIVAAKLNAANVARVTGDIPQNVNFAIKAEVARTFLDSKGIVYRTSRLDQQLSPADVGDMARPFTVYIECERGAPDQSAAVSPTRPQPSRGNSTSPDPGGSNGQPPCVAEFTKMREDVQKKGVAAKQASEKHVSREELCKLITAYSSAEGQWLKFTEHGVSACGIPEETANQLKQVHARTDLARERICAAGPGSGPSLSEALGTSRTRAGNAE